MFIYQNTPDPDGVSR